MYFGISDEPANFTYWTTKSGKKILLSHLEGEHLKNIIGFLKKKQSRVENGELICVGRMLDENALDYDGDCHMNEWVPIYAGKEYFKKVIEKMEKLALMKGER